MSEEEPSGPTASSEAIQRIILNLLAHDDQRPWSLEEIVRMVGVPHTRVDTQDALSYLRDTGLVNQAGEMFFASRAVAHIDRLGMLGL